MNHLNIIPIHDLEATELAPYRDQKDAWLRARHNPDATDTTTGTGLTGGLFMAEGELVVSELVVSPHEVISVLVAADRLGSLETLLGRMPAGTPIFVGEPSLLENLLGFRMHRGLLACGRAKPPVSEPALLESAQVLVIVEDLANHDNVGGIFRCARALGGEGVGVLLSRRSCDPLYRRALRVSIGHALHVPWAWANDWPDAIGRVREAGFTVLALTPSPDTVLLSEFADEIHPGEKYAILAGAEGPGLTDAAMSKANLRVRIPMHRAVDSLNVTVAVALSLHAVCANARH